MEKKPINISLKTGIILSIILIILVVAIYIFKVNTFGFMLFIVSFIEGIFVKMYELSINTQFYTLSKKFEYSNYNLVYEIVQNSFRSFVVFILLLSSFDLKTMIYITLGFIAFGVFLRFKQEIRLNKDFSMS